MASYFEEIIPDLGMCSHQKPRQMQTQSRARIILLDNLAACFLVPEDTREDDTTSERD
jgi:hypothetical protein